MALVKIKPYIVDETSDFTFNQVTTTGNITAANANLGNLAQASYLSGTLVTGAQPNITSVGTLSSLTVGPNSSIILSGTSGYLKANSIQGTDGVAAIYPYYGSESGAVGIVTNLTIGTSGTGNLIANNGTATFGAASDVVITGGSNGQVLTTDGSGNLSWATASGGLTITDDTTTNSTYYPSLTTATSGSISSANVSSTKLYFNPSTGALAATDFNSLSDETYKTNVVRLENVRQLLDKISGYSFDWKDGTGSSYGVLAQEVEKVMPNAVTNGERKTVNYAAISAFMIEAIKDLYVELDKIKQDISKLIE